MFLSLLLKHLFKNSNLIHQGYNLLLVMRACSVHDQFCRFNLVRSLGVVRIARSWDD